ncbi:MAG: hypothetical protein ACOH2E_08005 [Candidatus Paracaedibacter sp.]
MNTRYLLSFFALLCFSLSSWCMEPEKEKYGIEIPSVAEKTGLNARGFAHPEQYRSWSALNDFTAQTLHNFNTGDQRGLLYIHSLEDIMGAIECFNKKWNETYQSDQRVIKDGSDFYDVFTRQEFVDHYVAFVLAERFLIAGSIVAYCDINKHNLTATFSPVSFVMSIPPECIGVTERDDACTEVDYFPNINSVEDTKQKYNDEIERGKERITSLDFLARFPSIHNFGKNYKGRTYKMNEVAVLGCAVLGDKVYRPSIVAVLYNQAQTHLASDHADAQRNACLVEEAENYAKAQRLPFLINNACPIISKNEGIELAAEWFESQENTKTDLNAYRSHFLKYTAGPNLGIFEQWIKDRMRISLEARSMDYLIDKPAKDRTEDEQKLLDEIERNILQNIYDEPPARIQEIFIKKKIFKHKVKTFLLSDEELQHYALKRLDAKG